MDLEEILKMQSRVFTAYAQSGPRFSRHAIIYAQLWSCWDPVAIPTFHQLRNLAHSCSVRLNAEIAIDEHYGPDIYRIEAVFLDRCK